jgi:hypothetical protein
MSKLSKPNGKSRDSGGYRHPSKNKAAPISRMIAPAILSRFNANTGQPPFQLFE